MLESIKNTINRYGMLNGLNNPKKRIIVALSGGADSVYLLYCMNVLRLNRELDITLEACHVNHNLRGAESDGDELFVRELCNRMEIPLIVRSVDINKLIKKHMSIEECARNVRYSFFEEISAGALTATAHTADDNCETVLLNLLRGSALKGLCGIPPVRGNVIRPLIHTSRSEIEAFCKKNNLSYVSDSSNFKEDFTRNKLRLKIIPLLEEINPSLKAGIGRMSGALREDEAFLSEVASAVEKCALIITDSKKNIYDAEILAEQPSPVLNRIISSLLTQNNISPSSLRINGIAKIIRLGKGKINLCRDKFAVVKNNIFYLENIHQNYRKKT